MLCNTEDYIMNQLIFHISTLLIFIFWGIRVLPNKLNFIQILSSEAIKFFVSIRTLSVLAT